MMDCRRDETAVSVRRTRVSRYARIELQLARIVVSVFYRCFDRIGDRVGSLIVRMASERDKPRAEYEQIRTTIAALS